MEQEGNLDERKESDAPSQLPAQSLESGSGESFPHLNRATIQTEGGAVIEGDAPGGSNSVNVWGTYNDYRIMSPANEATRSVLPTTPEYIWNVPFARNTFFTGREELLDRLHQQLTSAEQNDTHEKGRAALTQPQAIKGLGGIGKTQAAVEYAYRYRQEYQSTLWVKADKLESLLSDFVAIARLVNLPEKDAEDQRLIAAAVKRWLEMTKGWLLIFDNADDLDMVKPFLPSASGGHVLLTTRVQSTGSVAQNIEVEKMDVSNGTLFLLRRVQILSPDASLKDALEADYAEAREIAMIMDGLPLALDQAGAYIDETRCGLHSYLDRYRKRGTHLLKRRGEFSSDHPESVYTTFSLSFEEVQLTNRTAADLLRLCAFLHPDAIPEEIIMKGSPDLGPDLQLVADDPVELDEALGKLLKYSLIHRDPRTETISIHRLVQEVLTSKMDEETQHTWAERAVKAVNRVFPVGEYITWSAYQRSLLHAQVCVAYIGRWNMMSREAIQLLNRIGWYRLHHAEYAQAEALITQALTFSQQTLEANSLDLASILINLALLADYYHQNYTEAEQYFQQAVTIRKQVLGPNHPDVAVSLHSLASFYYFQGKYSLAESLFQQVLTIREQTLAPNHPEIATVLNDLGQLYFNQGEYKKAELFCKRALAIREQTLEPNNPRIATSLNNLAKIRRTQEEFDEAESLCKRALTIREQSLGLHHPGVAQALENLAKIYIAQGRKYESVEMSGEGELSYSHKNRYEEAELLYKRALTIRIQVLGPNHPSVDYCLENLVELYKAQGKFAEVYLLYQEAIKSYERILGPDHSLTSIARKKYAPLLQKVKRKQEQQVKREQEATHQSHRYLRRLQKKRHE